MYNMTGVRLIINTNGRGSVITLENIILQIATLVALLKVPYIIGDIILLYLNNSKIK